MKSLKIDPLTEDTKLRITEIAQQCEHTVNQNRWQVERRRQIIEYLESEGCSRSVIEIVLRRCCQWLK